MGYLTGYVIDVEKRTKELKLYSKKELIQMIIEMEADFQNMQEFDSSI